ncbi:MAG: ABC transporter permease subunit [Actinobacteria bacterium]|nr:ABC transporter permease subunit [Actinomycetota bacterium]
MTTTEPETLRQHGYAAHPRRAVWHRRSFNGFMVLSAVLAALFLLAPTLIVIVISFGTDRFMTLPPSGWTVDWFGRIPPRYFESAWLSVRLATIVTVASVMLGVPAGLGLARSRMRAKALVDAIVRSPLQVPFVVIGVMSLFYYSLLNRTVGLGLLGTMTGLAIAHTIVTAPYVVVGVVASMAKFDVGLEDAAHGLGASRFTTFRLVIFPIIKPAVVAGSFFAFLVSFDEVPITLFITVAGAATLPVTMFLDAELQLSPVIYAVSSLLTLMSIGAVLLFARVVGLRGAMAPQ